MKRFSILCYYNIAKLKSVHSPAKKFRRVCHIMAVCHVY